MGSVWLLRGLRSWHTICVKELLDVAVSHTTGCGCSICGHVWRRYRFVDAVSRLLQAFAVLEMEKRHFFKASLEYVLMLQKVQERKKTEFVETVSVDLPLFAHLWNLDPFDCNGWWLLRFFSRYWGLCTAGWHSITKVRVSSLGSGCCGLVTWMPRWGERNASF